MPNEWNVSRSSLDLMIIPFPELITRTNKSPGINSTQTPWPMEGVSHQWPTDYSIFYIYTILILHYHLQKGKWIFYTTKRYPTMEHVMFANDGGLGVGETRGPNLTSAAPLLMMTWMRSRTHSLSCVWVTWLNLTRVPSIPYRSTAAGLLITFR